MSKAYLIKNNELIAVVDTEAENGESVEYTMGDYFSSATISRAKKWDSQACNRFGIELNINMFVIE